MTLSEISAALRDEVGDPSMARGLEAQRLHRLLSLADALDAERARCPVTAMLERLDVDEGVVFWLDHDTVCVGRTALDPGDDRDGYGATAADAMAFMDGVAEETPDAR